jgi:hypothetical protein
MGDVISCNNSALLPKHEGSIEIISCFAYLAYQTFYTLAALKTFYHQASLALNLLP